ncbi:DUF2514 domain-containing protein [Paracidovorax cattleyae]|uniref:DUF2514 domain-containing protein n=1 Tax=Paracidovorax cattleyae TaxID=80868 RepID=UPI0018AF5FB7|nr:DUF2514 domain-containing protein [Paracidovorax cattleyae]MBF9263578.1 DUF2514 domain-containing protein [Paracidovorax cattleyae]
MSTRLVIYGLLICGALVGVEAWQSHLIAKGDARGAARVQAAWRIETARRDKADADAAADAAHNQAEQERIARAAEQSKQQEVERVARDQAQREGALRQSLALATSRNRSLLDTIATLNARDAVQLSGTATDAGSAALADAARTARELLGQCSSRYTAVAANADRLANQVKGLQDFVRAVQQPAVGATAGATDGV